MIKKNWRISIILLSNLIHFSQEYAINTQSELSNRRNFQSKDTTGAMTHTQGCIQVCNNIDCLYLCPHPNRAVKRCATPLKSKNCCQNNLKESTPVSDSIKALNKLQQARMQYYGFMRDLENEIANRRLSIIKNLHPIVNKQHNFPSDLLQTIQPKSGKPKAYIRENDSAVEEKRVENNENTPQQAELKDEQTKTNSNLDKKQLSLNLLAHAIQNSHAFSETPESSTTMVPESLLMNRISENLEKTNENILSINSRTSEKSVSANSFSYDSPVSELQETRAVPNYTPLQKWLGNESNNGSYGGMNYIEDNPNSYGIPSGSDTYGKDYKVTTLNSIENGEYKTEATSHHYLKSDPFIYYTYFYPRNKGDSLKIENLVMTNEEGNRHLDQHTTPLTFRGSYTIPNSALDRSTENSKVVTARNSDSEIIETAKNENELRSIENDKTSESPTHLSRFLYTSPITFMDSSVNNSSSDLLNQNNLTSIKNSLQIQPETIKESEFGTEINDVGLTNEGINTVIPLASTDSFDSTPRFAYHKTAENEAVNLTSADLNSNRLSSLESPLLADPEPITESKITKEITDLSILKIIMTSETPIASKQNQLNDVLSKEELIENNIENDNKSYHEEFQNTFSTYSDLQSIEETSDIDETSKIYASVNTISIQDNEPTESPVGEMFRNYKEYNNTANETFDKNVEYDKRSTDTKNEMMLQSVEQQNESEYITPLPIHDEINEKKNGEILSEIMSYELNTQTVLPTMTSARPTASKQNQLNDELSKKELIDKYLDNDNKSYYEEFLNAFRSFNAASDTQNIEETSSINEASGSTQSYTLANTLSFQDNESTANEKLDENMEFDKRSTDANQNDMMQTLYEMRTSSESINQLPIHDEINEKKNGEILSEIMSYELNTQTVLPTMTSARPTASKQNQLNDELSKKELIDKYLDNDNKSYYEEFLNAFRSFNAASDTQNIEETSSINEASGSTQSYTLANTLSFQDNESTANEKLDENMEFDKRSTDVNQNDVMQTLDEMRSESESINRLPVHDEINVKKNGEILSEIISNELNTQTVLPTLAETKIDVLNSLNYTQLKESKENYDGNISSNSSYKHEKRTENPLTILTLEKDIEANAESGNKEDSNIKTESNLSDVINSEMNSVDQKKIVIKKREGEMPFNEDIECECNDQTEKSAKKSSTRSNYNTFYSPNYNAMPLFLLIASPYPVHNFGNQKVNSDQNGNMFLDEAHVYNGAISHPLLGYPVLPYNNWHNIQQEIVPITLFNPSYLPQPWQSNLEQSQLEITDESMRPITDYPPSEETTQSNLENSQLENTSKLMTLNDEDLNTSTPMILNDEELDTSTPITQNEELDTSTPITQNEELDTSTQMTLNNEELTTSIPADILEMYEALLPIVEANMPETKRTERNERKHNGSYEYVFESGQFVKLRQDPEETESINTQGRAEDIALAAIADNLSVPAEERVLPETVSNEDSGVVGQVVQVAPNEIPSRIKSNPYQYDPRQTESPSISVGPINIILNNI